MREALQIAEPASGPSTENALWLAQTCEGLVRFAADSVRVEPALAEEFRVSADGTQWTFHLRHGVRFHDGTPLDSRAVHFCFMRLLDPNHPYAARGALGVARAIFGDERNPAAPFVKDIRTPDPQTLVLVLSRPDAGLPRRLARIEAAIMSPMAVQAAAADGATTVVGTGPMRIKAIREGFSVVLERNEQYWGGAAAVRQLEFRSVPDANERERALREGLCDAGQRFSPDRLRELEKVDRLRVVQGRAMHTCVLWLNTRIAPLDQPQVRRALSLAIDRAAGTRNVMRGYAQSATGFFPPAIGEAPTTSVVERGAVPAAARELLAQAGLSGGFTLKLIIPSEERVWNPAGAAVGEWLVSDLAKIHVQVVTELVAADTLRQRVQSGDFQAALWGLASPSGEIADYMSQAMSLRQGALGAGTGDDDALSELVAAAQSELNPTRRENIHAQLQEKLAGTMPWIPLVHADQVLVARDALTGVCLNPVGLHHIWEWSWQ
jgi:peptide/nickel transport system substrate-binding protein